MPQKLLLSALLTYHGSAANNHDESEDLDFYLFFWDRYHAHLLGISNHLASERPRYYYKRVTYITRCHALG